MSAGTEGGVCVGAQQVSVGKNFSGSHCDLLVTDELLQFWIGDHLVKAATRTDPRPIRKKRAAGTSPRRWIRNGVSRINRHTTVKHHPKANSGSTLKALTRASALWGLY